MFDFSKVKARERINKDFILSRINEEHIFRYYHGSFELGKVYPSKFRADKHPSCGFFVSPRGKLYYNDIAKRIKYDCFDFVQAMYNLSFKDAVEKVAFDFGLIDGVQKPAVKKIIADLKDFDKTIKKETMIIFKPALWDDENFAFWKRFHITKQELEREDIYAVKTLYVNGIKIPNPNNELRYALTTMVDGDMRTKLYVPYSDTLKWLTNIPTSHPFGMDKLNHESEDCFVAKSQKCRIVLLKFLPAVIAIQSEQPSAISEKTDSELKFHFSKLYLGGDNDETGLRFMQEMEPQGYIPMGLPQGFPKDYSDLSEAKGLKAVEKFLKQKKLI